jgi:S1-C subfamily serine protease
MDREPRSGDRTQGVAMHETAVEPNETEPMRAGRGPGRLLVGLVVTAALLVGAAAFGGYRLHDQAQQLDRAQAALTELQRSQAASERAAAAALKATQSQVSVLAAQLTKTQNDLKRDEQQLKLTTSQLPPDLTKLASKVSPSVVMIACGAGFGTGFVLSLPATAGYRSVVVTAAHVIEDCAPGAEPTVQTLTVIHDGQSISARLRSTDAEADVALLDLTAKLPALQPADDPTTGEFVMAVGNPLGLTNNVTQGNVSKVAEDVVLHTAPISSGNSGGPLVDRDGRVIGVVDASFTPSEGTPVVENLNIAVRLSQLCSTLLTGRPCASLK